MTDLTIYLILLGLIVSFWIWELVIAHRDKKRRLRREQERQTDNDIIAIRAGGDMQSVDAALKTIGEDSYRKMTDRLSKLLHRHVDDEYMTMHLKEAEVSDLGMDTLHNLLPGDKLYLLCGYSADGRGFQVFAEGRMIGSVSRQTSDCLFDIMRRGRLEGVYVWKQNCYGATTKTDLDLIAFYTVKEEMESEFSDLPDFGLEPYQLAVRGVRDFTLITN